MAVALKWKDGRPALEEFGTTGNQNSKALGEAQELVRSLEPKSTENKISRLEYQQAVLLMEFFIGKGVTSGRKPQSSPNKIDKL